MICHNCRRRLRADATSCLCGKFGPAFQAHYAPRLIPCCFDTCPEGAICRIHVSTGWANVCLKHYPQVARNEVPYSKNNETVAEIRKVYEQSYHYRQKHGGRPVVLQDRSALERELAEVKRKMEAAMQREPGSDDDLPPGIEQDPLEQEFLDKAQP